jgi:hypothetical protein
MLNMCIKVTPAPASDSMLIQVVGPRAHKLFDPNMDWRLTAKQADFTTARGDVALTSDPATWGRMYSRGLFVAVDEKLRALHVAVNVRTQLTRDRHVLPTHPDPTPLDSLAEILAALLSVRGADSSSCAVLFTHLLDCFVTDKMDPHIVAAAGDTALKHVMKSFHAEHLGTTVDNIVYAAEECDQRTAFVLKQLNVSVVNNSGALEDKIDLDARIFQLLARLPDYIPSTTEAPYLAALMKYVAALSLNSVRYQGRPLYNFILSVKATQLTQCCAANNALTTVYLTGDLLQRDNWKVAAVILLLKLSSCFEGDMLVPLHTDQQRFLADPLNFEPRRLHTAVEGLSAQGSSTTRSHSAVERLRVSYENMRLPSSSPNSMVKSCSFRGVPQAFPTVVAVENHTELDCSCAGGLVPTALVRDTQYSAIPIYIDAALQNDPAFVARMQAVDNMDRRILHASQLLRVMRRNIVRELELDISSIGEAVSDDAIVPIVMVICNDLLGFTYEGAVYVNVAPVLWHTGGVEALCEALLLTILHELAHRSKL